ncbi:galactokinase family protein [Corynebacterium sp. MSK297]|uniref:galactokinase family protein n=1 Tax=Corynebacterium sp. MSK297 TaxID=3050221 RepID=UPI00254C833C|nr:galactokinase family protein [Corynebacterium sp. MSK297]MDK8845269.1 galactokinase family protein [Corynebacterium sp. MSK297]
MPQAPQTDNFADDASSTETAKTAAKTAAKTDPAVTDTTALTAATTRWHTELYGVAPTFLAHAPATWSVIGEHVDHAGGVVVMSLAGQRAAVSVSPREDHKFVVHFRRDSLADARGTGQPASTEQSTTAEEIAELFSQQQPDVDDSGKPITPPLPRGGLAHRLGGIVWMMMQRQLLSRDTTGMNITVVSAITPESGLGEYAAIDSALALALQSDAPDVDEAPLRARLAEVCAQAGELFSSTVTLRARYSAALRGAGAGSNSGSGSNAGSGAGTQVSVLDYADGSLTKAVHPVTRELAAFAVTVSRGVSTNNDNNDDTSPENTNAGSDSETAPATGQSDEIRTRNRFVDSARQAFGAQSLRLLPDAPARVTQWLSAVHQVHGTDGVPELHESRTWLDFHAAETERAQRFAHAIRSQRARDIWPLLRDSQQALQDDYTLDASMELAQLCQVRGAIGARAAAAGTSKAVIAYVDKKKADNFAHDLVADGFAVTRLIPGDIAQLG